MIIVLKKDTPLEKINEIKSKLENANIEVNTIKGSHTTVLGLIGDTTLVSMEDLKSLNCVAEVKRIQEPYKNANRKFHPDDTVVSVGNAKFGGGNFSVIAGPCSVESEEQMKIVSRSVKASGAKLLRGGAFKPRTSPYSFQGLREKGIEFLEASKNETNLPIVTEIMSADHLPLFENVDIIQVGARNMQNFELLKALGKIDKPILLKRGLANTLDELLMSAEYIMAGGNQNVILCERGIRTFETATRNTLDISAIPLLKEKSHLPVVVDPSHSAGIRSLVEPLSMAAIAAGADGLIIEVHNNPEKALCDGAQSLTMDGFEALMTKINKTASFFGKRI